MRPKIALWFALLISRAVSAQEGITPLLYRAVQIVRGTASETVLMPEPFEGYDAGNPEDSILRAFEALKAKKASEYGKATLLLDKKPGGLLRATLNLDPNVADSHSVVVEEVFHTLRGLGVSEMVFLGLGDGQPDLTRLRYPVFMMAVPYYEALPPRHYSGALIILAAETAMPSEAFYARLAQGDQSLTEMVLSGLSAKDDRVRLAVLAALPNLKAGGKVGRLLALLSDPSPAVRLAVVNLLKGERTDEVTLRLMQLAEQDQDFAVKVAAARVLAERGVKDYEFLLDLDKLSDPSSEVVIAAIARLVESRNPAVADGLYRCLVHRSAEVRESARKALLQIGAEGAMAKAVQDDAIDVETREVFALAILRSGKSEGREKALQMLVEHGSKPGALSAIDVIAKSLPPEGLAVLYRALLRQEAEVRLAAMEAIVAYRNPVGIPALLSAAKSETERRLAEKAAVQILLHQPLDVLERMMEGSDPVLKRLAMKALGDLIEQGTQAPPRALAMLQARLKDPDVEMRRAAVYALARMPDERAARSVMELFDDSDPQIRAQAVVAAGRVRDEAASRILIQALSDESEDVVIAAIDGVARTKMAAALEPLRLLCGHGNQEIRRGAVRAYLDALGPDGAAQDLDFLTRLLYSRDPEVKKAVIEVVRKVHERRAIVALSALVIDPDREVKIAAVRALATTGEKDALEGIEKAVFDADKEIRLIALEALGMLGRKEAIDFLDELIKLEQDLDVRSKAEEVRAKLLSR